MITVRKPGIISLCKLVILFIISITVIACQPNSGLFSPKSTPTPAFTSTPTLIPTKTPIPTSTPDPTIIACAGESQEYFTESKKILSEWSDGFDLANNTSRISLSGPISDLQRIRREWENLYTPACLTTAKDKMTESMDDIIQGFLSFMAQDTDSVVKTYFDHAVTLQDEYNDSITKFKAQINQ